MQQNAIDSGGPITFVGSAAEIAQMLDGLLPQRDSEQPVRRTSSN